MNGWADVPLGVEGLLQAQQVGERLRREHPIAPVYSSPLRRTAETARPIAAGTQRMFRFVRSLREINCGVVDGWPVSRVRSEYPEWWEANLRQQDDEFRWPEGESYRHFRARVLRAIASIARRHEGEEVIVVTHTGVITQIIGSFCGEPPARWDTWRPHHASITTIEVAGDEAKLVRFDDHEHIRKA